MLPETLRRWCAEGVAETATALIPIEVVADTVEAAPGGDGRIRIVTAMGHRIEGLTIADAIALARVLG